MTLYEQYLNTLAINFNYKSVKQLSEAEMERLTALYLEFKIDRMDRSEALTDRNGVDPYELLYQHMKGQITQDELVKGFKYCAMGYVGWNIEKDFELAVERYDELQNQFEFLTPEEHYGRLQTL